MKKTIALVLCIVTLLSCVLPVSAYGFSGNGSATKKATAYRLPSANSGEVWWVDKNDKLQVFCKDGDYYLVLYPFNNTGKHVLAYVPTSAVSASGVPVAAGFYRNETAKAIANATLYHNPSTDTLIGASGSNQTIRATISKGQEITILFEKDGFYCVRTASDVGFLEKSVVCTHSQLQQNVTSYLVSQKDDTYHTVTDTYDEICAQCGEIVRKSATKTYEEKHALQNDMCAKCGYAAPDTDAARCKHLNTAKHASDGMPTTTSIKNDKQHTTVSYYDLYCTDCHAYLERNLSEFVDEDHEFVNNICQKCNLENLVTEKPAAATLSLSKTSFAPSETISLNWTTAERAGWYDLHIYKEGQTARYRLEGSFPGNSATTKIDEEGTYTLCIYAVNSAGWTAGNIVKITVVDNTKRTAWVYNTDGDNLNLRSKASTSSSVITKMPAGSELTVTGNETNGFYPVKYGNYSGYASSAYITFTKPATATTSATNTSYVWPSSGGYLVYVLDYYYGSTRGGAHPTKGGGAIKGAIDIATTGNALATATGTIIETKYGYNSGWGNNITIKHDDGTYSFYAHLSKINVSVNQRVTAGQTIGVIGTTGNSTGVHLHFEIWDSSKKTMYTIDAFKEKYKKQLVYDGDIVTGGANSNAIKSWVQNHYKMSGGRWYANK